MHKKWLFLATLAIIMGGLVSLYFILKDKRIKPTNKTINKIKIHQVLDEGYTYRVDWIPGQDKLIGRQMERKFLFLKLRIYEIQSQFRPL